MKTSIKLALATVVATSLAFATGCGSTIKSKGNGTATNPADITKLCVVNNISKRGSDTFENEMLKAIDSLGYVSELIDNEQSALPAKCSHVITYVANHDKSDTVIMAVHTGLYQVLADGTLNRTSDFKFRGKIKPSANAETAQTQVKSILLTIINAHK